MGERRKRERGTERETETKRQRENHLVFIKEINEAEVRN